MTSTSSDLSAQKIPAFCAGFPSDQFYISEPAVNISAWAARLDLADVWQQILAQAPS